MSQFMLIERDVATRSLPGVLLTKIPDEDDFFRDVAMTYFRDWRRCRVVTDLTGRGEPLVDDVCDARRAGSQIEETTFARFLRLLVDARVQFVCWCGSDHQNLPTAHAWSEVVEQISAQTNMQPADLYLHFVPSCASST